MHRAFLEELRRFGFSESQNLGIDLHTTDHDLPALSKQAADMVRANPQSFKVMRPLVRTGP
jgi:hypothetical protein